MSQSDRLFNFYVCERHEQIIGLEQGNNRYHEHCDGGERCGWETDAGFLILDSQNGVKEFYLEPWVISNIERRHYSFSEDDVLTDLYDVNGELVELD